MSSENKITPEQTNLNYKNDITTFKIDFLVKDIALKTLLFSMVFYIINSKLVNKLLSCLDKYPMIERNLIQAILFGLVFYIISVNL
jgi:hypothetical protein